MGDRFFKIQYLTEMLPCLLRESQKIYSLPSLPYLKEEINFRVALCHSGKTRLRAKLFMWKYVSDHFHEKKKLIFILKILPMAYRSADPKRPETLSYFFLKLSPFILGFVLWFPDFPSEFSLKKKTYCTARLDNKLPQCFAARMSRKYGGRYAGKRKNTTSNCWFSRSILLTGPFMIFPGYLLQSCHRPSVIFPCLLHDSCVAEWCF